MKLRFLLLVIALLLTLSACQGQETINFKGKSDNWEVVYQVDIQSEDSESTSLEIKYIGEGKSPKEMDYTLDSVSGGGDGNNIPLNDGVYKSSPNNCSGCAVTGEDDNIKVTIEWQGKSEKITLSNQR